MKKKMQAWPLAAGMTLAASGPAFAQVTGNAQQVAMTLSTVASWLASVLGPGLFLIGLLVCGASLAMGNEDAMRRGYYVLGGGVVVFLANPIVALVRTMTGN